MTELELKNEELKELEKRRNELFELMKPIERELKTNYKKIEKVKDEIGKMLIEENPCDWSILLDESKGDLIYKKYNEELYKRGLHSGGYLPDTGQRCITVCLTRDDTHSLSRTIHALNEILPYIKPMVKEYTGYKYIGVFENTLSQYGVYFLLIHEKDDVFKLMQTVYSRTSELKRFTSLKELIKYVQKNYWYSEE